MKVMRSGAILLLLMVGFACLTNDWIAPHNYSEQFREIPNAVPTPSFLLGTDALGRDRFSRLLAAGRISFLLAPATALFALAMATLVGLISGYGSRWVDSSLSGFMELILSLPWLFAILTLRSLMPLNAPPIVSMVATAAVIACIGWAPPARVIRAAVLQLRESPAILQARAAGVDGWRLLAVHLTPNLQPILRAQFWVLVPVFLITEANLGILGLGVSEPTPTLGGMLAELQHFDRISEAPWILAPAILLITMVTCIRIIMSGPKTWE